MEHVGKVVERVKEQVAGNAHDIPPSAMHVQPHESQPKDESKWLNTRYVGMMLNRNATPGQWAKLGREAIQAGLFNGGWKKEGLRYYVNEIAFKGYLTQLKRRVQAEEKAKKAFHDDMKRKREARKTEVQAAGELHTAHPDQAFVDTVLPEGTIKRACKLFNDSTDIIKALEFAKKEECLIRVAYSRVKNGKRWVINWDHPTNIQWTFVRGLKIEGNPITGEVAAYASTVNFASEPDRSRTVSAIGFVEVLIPEDVMAKYRANAAESTEAKAARLAHAAA